MPNPIANPTEKQVTPTLSSPEATRPHSPSDAPAQGDRPSPPPGFELLDVLGRGGMGVVYLARQTKLNREVALKMILSGGHASDDDRTRFLAEAEAIAALNHHGIVQVYEYGTHAGQPYFAMEYCPGGSLARQLDGTPRPAKDAATLMQKLAYAVQAAHEKGIVHRDLKPANVLLTKNLTAEKAEDAEKGKETGISTAFSAISAVKISDFGLAKRSESGPDLTRTGAILGTPSYMAPEQALGKGSKVGPAADVYALGAMLYELLTGRPPFKADNALETLQQVVDEDPVSIRQLQKKVPVDLETIAHKCLHKDAQRRYATARELARDLGRWQGGEPIQARPARRVEKVIKWARRRPAVAGLVVALTVAISAGCVSTWLFAAEASREAISAQRLVHELEQAGEMRARTAIRLVQFLRSSPSVLDLPDNEFKREFASRFVDANEDLTVDDLKNVFRPLSNSQGPNVDLGAEGLGAGDLVNIPSVIIDSAGKVQWRQRTTTTDKVEIVGSVGPMTEHVRYLKWYVPGFLAPNMIGD